MSCCFGPKVCLLTKTEKPYFRVNNIITLFTCYHKSSFKSSPDKIINVLTFSTITWGTKLTVSAAAVVPRLCLLTMIEKLYFSVKYTFYLFLQVVLSIISGQISNLLPFSITRRKEFHFQLLQWYQHCTFKERMKRIISVR